MKRLLLLTACLTASAGLARATPPTLTIYAAQHPQVEAMLADAFTKQTGIPVRLHQGEAPEIAAQILEEGATSPADIFFTENSPELNLLDEKGLLAPVDPATLAQVPAQYSATDGDWLGVLARENVLAYNPAKIQESALPASLLDLAKPEWKGKIGIAPSDGDFLPLVSAVIKEDGKAAALAWLKGLKTNAKIYEDDEGVAAAVAHGDVAAGIINNYYWYRLETQLGATGIHSRVYHFTHGDVGGLVNVSGAAILKSSKHQKEAQEFLAFLVSQSAQEMLGKSNVDFEYPLRPGVSPNKALKPFNDLQPPPIKAADLGDDQEAGRLLQQAGLI
ncbi:iron ABC transporter substrate-binding protein [Acidocella sp.]|uniref:iron ABC transporter substrate-binding protein n=1 Tax=Acidocella sp. TaxID=50710 RepID=UPI003D0568D6